MPDYGFGWPMMPQSAMTQQTFMGRMMAHIYPTPEEQMTQAMVQPMVDGIKNKPVQDIQDKKWSQKMQVFQALLANGVEPDAAMSQAGISF